MPSSDKMHEPPKWPMKVIKVVLRADYLEEIEGDMYEEYQYHLEVFSRRKAQYLYCRETFKVLRSSLIKKPFKTQKINTMGMITNYSKITLRNIRKNKVPAAIKIGGFAISIAISLLICLFVISEWEKDQALADTQVYKMVYQSKNPEQPYKTSTVPAPLAKAMKRDYPEIVESGRTLVFDGFGDAGGNLFRPLGAETSIYEDKFAYADPSILRMLQFDMVHGDVNTALDEPLSLIMSSTKANKYFPGENPVGKTILINEKEDKPYTIKGVFADLDNSHLHSVDFFFTLSGKEFWRNEQGSWCCSNYTTYIALAEDTPLSSFEGKLKAIHDQYFLAYEKENDPIYAAMIEEFNTLSIIHVSDIYLHSKDVYDFLLLGDIRIVTMFGIVALFIVLLACVNFINLATANSMERAMEIGLRKVVGSGRKGIIHQFLTEAVILSLISTLMGVIMAALALPMFNEVVGKSIAIPFNQPVFYVILLLFALFIGLLSGAYPALYLSGLQTIKVLGGRLRNTAFGNASKLRSVLVVFQFAISMFLIAGAFIVYKQMDLILSKDLGYDKDQIVTIHGLSSMEASMLTFKKKLEDLPEVESATFSNSLPIEGTHRNGNSFYNAGRQNVDKAVSGQFWRADDDYFETLGIELKEGRTFSNDRAADSMSVVINEAMAQQLGLKEPLGAMVENWAKWRVVGVMKDFNYDHLRDSVRPLLLARTKYADLLAVKLQTEDIVSTLAKIEKEWQGMNPHQTIRITFLDQEFKAMYEEVSRTRTIFLAFAIFAIIVACLGLTGLTMHSIAIRTKEITVRKVLGASFQSILSLLSVEYLRLIFISIIVAVPVGWYLSNEWLSEFTYSIPNTWDAFIMGAIMLIIIALGVVSLQSIGAALRNPAIGLRNE